MSCPFIMKLFLIPILMFSTYSLKAESTNVRLSEALAMLKTTDFRAGLKILRQIGDPAVPAALELLLTERETIGAARIFVCDFILSTNGPEFEKALPILAMDQDTYFRGMTARAIGIKGNRKFTNILIDLLQDRREFLKEEWTDPAGERSISVQETSEESLAKLYPKKVKKELPLTEKVKRWLDLWDKNKLSDHHK